MMTNDNKGMTLIELMVVIAIVGILVVALGFSFVGWQGKYRVESQTKDIYSDLMNARARAMGRSRMHFVNFPDTASYEVYEDTSAAGVPSIDGDTKLQTANDTRLPTFPKTLEYAGTIATAASGTLAPPGPAWFAFNNQGRMASINGDATDLDGTICIFTDEDGDGTSEFDPDYDCIEVSQTRISMGKLTSQNPGDCDAANCTEK